LEWRATTICL